MATITTPAPTDDARLGTLTQRQRDVRGGLFRLALSISVIVSIVILATLIYEMASQGRPVLTTRLGDFLTSGFKTNPELAGVWQGIKGTLMLSVIVALVAFPIGVGAAVYLEEYAADSRFARIVNINIRNLAGVPSIVYGLLGLAIFVQALGTDLGDGGGLTGGRTVITGGLTLAVLVLPIVIITTQEALRAVPAGLREGALALGATRWETIRTTVFPAAAPGILTGTVLALARSAGEAAPLLVIGASTSVFLTGDQSLLEQVTDGRFTALPMTIYSWARLPASRGWHELVGAASVILVALVVVMNGAAIMLRNRFERRW
ncbi:MAG TPA: phosphate ABC transporter permease PstA [Acidimicrobiia bacterium]|nr:phosphate ABC transporter permease PstA [Acidimicrobiia bacterium]